MNATEALAAALHIVKCRDDDPRHVYEFDATDILAALRASGFDVMPTGDAGLDHAPDCDVFRIAESWEPYGEPRHCDCGFALWDAKRRGVYNWTPPTGDAGLDVRDCECVAGHRCDCQDLRSLLYRILTNAEYQKMEAEGLAAAALGLTWSESEDRYRLSSSDTGGRG